MKFKSLTTIPCKHGFYHTFKIRNDGSFQMILKLKGKDVVHNISESWTTSKEQTKELLKFIRNALLEQSE